MNRKKCRFCQSHYRPTQVGQKHCGAIECKARWAEEWLEKDRAKKHRALAQAKLEEKRKDKARREALMGVREWLKKCQEAFNAMIRFRDRGKPCISCGNPIKIHPGVRSHTYDCGHYRSVGAAPHLRFDESNAHGQCVSCNRDKSGNVVEYRIRLVQRIGLQEVERVESDNTPRHWSPADLKRMTEEYRSRLSAMKKEAERVCTG